jgi:DNA-binding CsgD family transcriptional regulator/PAS domain-containing protein
METSRWDEEGFARIATLASAAALQTNLWAEVGAAIGAALGANGAALVSPGLDPEGRSLSAAVGSAHAALSDYVTHWAPEDPWWQRLGGLPAGVTSGSCIVGEELLTLDELKGTPFYNEFCRPHDIESVATMLIWNGQGGHAPPTQLSVFRGPTSRAFELEDKRKLQALSPHLQRAIDTYWVLRKARDFDRIAEASLDALPQPTWVLRDDLTIDYANLQARTLMGTAPWLHLGARHLRAVGGVDSTTLRSAMRSADIGGGLALMAAIPMGKRLRPGVLRIAPVRAAVPYATAWPHARALLMLELPPPDDVNTQWATRLSKRYGLTPMQCRVLERLSAGLSPHQISDEMGVSYTTTRAHLRALYDKTGCHRQAELVRLGLGV